MHSNLRRLPAERAIHKKRLASQDGWESHNVAREFVFGSLTFTGPITITTVIPASPTFTTSLNILTSAPPSSSSIASVTSSNTILSSSSSATILNTPPTSPAVTPVAPASPIASAIASPSVTGKSSNSSEGVAAVSTQHGLPTGAIVGITIACVILLLGAVLFFVRQRALRGRRQARQSMVAWQTARPTIVPPSSAGMGMTQQATPGVSFAQLQAAALPQPLASTYNNPIPPPAPLSVPLPASAGVGAAALGAATATPYPSATVVYEFIPTLPDELSITTGETVRLVTEFDDGWALCANARGEQGMVPLECLDRGSSSSTAVVAQAIENYRNSRRTSSLAVRN